MASGLHNRRHEQARLRSRRLFPVLALGGSTVAWMLTAFRAATTGITYDEADTYMRYCQRLLGFLSLDQANNHPLNSLLVYLSSRLLGRPYDEFVIRLPVLVAFAVYLGLSYGLARRSRSPFLLFTLLAFNYYLDEFFGLARGYGIAAAFVLAALYVYTLNRQRDANLLIAGTLLVLGSTAMYFTLVLLVGFAVYAGLCDIRISRLRTFVARNVLAITVLSGSSLFIVYSFWEVTRPGLFVYGAGDAGFYSAIMLGFAHMFSGNALIANTTAVLTAVLLLGAVGTRLRRLQEMPFTSLLLVSLLITWLVAAIMKAQLPKGRELLPLWPLLALACNEALVRFSDLSGKQGIAISVSIGAAILLLATFGAAIDLQETTDWRSSYPLRAMVYRAAIDHRPLPKTDDPAVPFYVHQIETRFQPAYMIPTEEP